MSITFTKEIVQRLFADYARLVFCDAVRSLRQRSLLDEEDQVIISLATRQAASDPSFLRRSSIIYLSHGLMDHDLSASPQELKHQLLFELVINLMEAGAITSMTFANTDTKLFSLCLNRPIEKEFDHIRKEEGTYKFTKDRQLVLATSRNKDSAVTDDIAVLEQDRNPFNIHNTHPDVDFVQYDLGGKTLQEWVTQFRNAYALIKEQTPGIFGEIYSFLDAIVPHGYEPNRQLSSSYTKSPGILYLSYTDTDLKQAEAIIHEVHHTIFNIIDWKYGLLKNKEEFKYYSPYRPDARALRGCFLGLHAFVAVQNFYRTILEAGTLERKEHDKIIDEFLAFYIKNGQTIEVLERHADFTQGGEALFRDIKGRYALDHDFVEGLEKTHDSKVRDARSAAKEHLSKAEKENEILLH